MEIEFFRVDSITIFRFAAIVSIFTFHSIFDCKGNQALNCSPLSQNCHFCDTSDEITGNRPSVNRYLGRSVSVAFPSSIVTRLAVSIAVSFPTYLHMQLSLHPIKANVGLVKSKTQCEIIN